MQKIKTYKSGLRLVVEPDNSESVSFNIFVKAGSEKETNNEKGISHLIEHMMFKTTKNHTNYELMKEFDKIGSSINASTSKKETSYYVKCLREFLPRSVELMSDMFFNHKFDEKELTTEKEVVLEEIAMINDDAGSLAFENLSSAFYKNTTLENPIAGTSESVKALTANDLHNYVKKHYTPDNVILSFAGNITLNEAQQLADKYFQSNYKQIGLPSYEEKLSQMLLPKSAFKVANKEENKQANIFIAFPSFNSYDSRLKPAQLLSTAIGSGMSSRLFTKVREELGLVYSIFSHIETNNQAGFIMVGFSTTTKNVKTATLAVKILLDEVAEKGITHEELDIAKTAIISEKKYASERNQNTARANAIKLSIYDKLKELPQELKEIKDITIEQVNEAAKQVFTSKNVIVSYAGQKNNENLLNLFVNQTDEEKAEQEKDEMQA